VEYRINYDEARETGRRTPRRQAKDAPRPKYPKVEVTEYQEFKQVNGLFGVENNLKYDGAIC
jgi:hypothetical protein